MNANKDITFLKGLLFCLTLGWLLIIGSQMKLEHPFRDNLSQI